MGMDLLVVLATSIAYLYSVVVVILDTVIDLNFELFFDSGPLLLMFISFGRLLEHIAKVHYKFCGSHAGTGMCTIRSV